MKDFAHPGGESGPADINRLIKSTVDVSRNEWKYDAEMQLELAEDLAQPHCDAGQLKQVFLNMIVNAAHAIADADRSPGTITVATTSDDDTVTIRIADNGAGMTDEVKSRVFERFFTTKEVGRGSGQGLAIAYDAVHAHGGTIGVDSTVGVGTTFTIQLPIEPGSSTS
jgi:signal transduction histidine kinase